HTVHNVQIHDETPLGSQLVGTAPRAEVAGSRVTWDIGTLAPGEERTVEMELLPLEEGELGSVAQVTFGAEASAKARCTRPELALRLAAAPKVLIGKQHMVQVEISNPGSGDATGVMLLESLPTNVSHPAGAALEFAVGTLRAGETRRLELLLNAEQAGRVVNSMTARADANLEVEASVEFEVIAPELNLQIDGPQRRFLERPATYTVSIENPGTAPAHDVQLITKLPPALKFVSANNMGEYDQATHSVYWSLAELPANESGAVELVTMPVSSGEHRLEAASKAEQGLEARTETSIVVEGIAALMFEVVDLQDPVEVGGETSYEIRVVNQGSKAAANVQIAALLPPGLQPLDARADVRHRVQGDRIVFEPIAALPPKAEMTLQIRAKGVQAGDQRMRVRIMTDDLQQPITKEESTRVYAD
ncbi:MAG: DUF11 domain-containing protein, partial [Planctomycetales bacterium]|nr:DUF11 domain-containing protein [Planctomycetales bacterium]